MFTVVLDVYRDSLVSGWWVVSSKLLLPVVYRLMSWSRDFRVRSGSSTWTRSARWLTHCCSPGKSWCPGKPRSIRFATGFTFRGQQGLARKPMHYFMAKTRVSDSHAGQASVPLHHQRGDGAAQSESELQDTSGLCRPLHRGRCLQAHRLPQAGGLCSSIVYYCKTSKLAKIWISNSMQVQNQRHKNCLIFVNLPH